MFATQERIPQPLRFGVDGHLEKCFQLRFNGIRVFKPKDLLAEYSLTISSAIREEKTTNWRAFPRNFQRNAGEVRVPFRLRGGEGGIRTLDTGVSPYNGLANRRIRPLCHLSAALSHVLHRTRATVFRLEGVRSASGRAWPEIRVVPDFQSSLPPLTVNISRCRAKSSFPKRSP